jgi:hypothetical protein
MAEPRLIVAVLVKSSPVKEVIMNPSLSGTLGVTHALTLVSATDKVAVPFVPSLRLLDVIVGTKVLVDDGVGANKLTLIDCDSAPL